MLRVRRRREALEKKERGIPCKERGREGRERERREVPRESEGDWKERNGRDAADIA